MKNGELQSFRDKLRATDTFQNLSSVAQKITMSRNNVNHIANGFNIAKLHGIKKFCREFGFNRRNQELIKDLIKDEKA